MVSWYDPDNLGQAFYEANLENSYVLVRSGKYVELLKDRFGDAASGLISDITVLGHVRIGDLTKTYFPSVDERGPLSEIIASNSSPQSGDKQTVRPGDDAGEAVHTIDELHSVIGDLLGAGLLCLIHASYFRSSADNLAEAEHAVPRDGSIKSKKQQEATWELDMQQKLEDWKYGSKSEIQGLTQSLQHKKRTLEGDQDGLPPKKRKIAHSRSESSQQKTTDREPASSGWLDVSGASQESIVV